VSERTLRLRARWVLAHDGTDHRLLTDGEVVVRGAVIERVGHPAPGPADETVELGDAVLLPGFVDLDALADVDHAILDSWNGPEGAARLQWSRRYARGGPRPVFDAAERAEIRRFALAELLLHGVTTAMPIASEVHSDWAESFADAQAMATAAEDLGLRVFLGPSYRSGVPVLDEDGTVDIYWDPARGEAGLADAVRFVEWCRERASDLVTGVLLPCRIETMTDDLLRQTGEQARRLGALVRLHCLQGLNELRLLRETRGATPVGLLRQTGLLQPGLLVPHAVFTDSHPVLGGDGQPGADVQALAAADVTVIHCPLTSARYAAALHSFDSYRRAGVRVALGTDSYPPDLLRGIDTGMAVAKVISGRTDAAPHADYLRSATTAGADALRRPDLGRLRPGAAADIIAVRLDDVRDGVVDDPVRTLIQHTTARAVSLSVVGGRVVVRDGTLVGDDMARLRARAQELFGRMRAAYGERTDPPAAAGTLFPPAFAPWDEP
jgi:cytosine/adenosine deaminase-related metal-dependent hydrolase